MSDTPRTDEVYAKSLGADGYANLARQLERELNLAEAKLTYLRSHRAGEMGEKLYKLEHDLAECREELRLRHEADVKVSFSTSATPRTDEVERTRCATHSHYGLLQHARLLELELNAALEINEVNAIDAYKLQDSAEHQLAKRVLRDCDPAGEDGEKVILARAYLAAMECFETKATVLAVGEPCAGRWELPNVIYGKDRWECPCGATTPAECRTETAKP